MRRGRDPSTARRARFALVALCASVALASLAPAVAARRVIEKSINLDIAFRVADRLTAAGVPVILTRTGDQTLELGDRTALANRRRVDAFVSIHNNGSRNRRAGGTEVYHQIRGGASGVLGEAIRAQLAGRTGLPTSLHARRGDHGDYYYVLRNTTMPAVIVEGAYVTNSREARLLAQESFRQALAEGIAAGILDYQRTLVARPLPALAEPTRVRVPALSPPARFAGEAVNSQTVTLTWLASRLMSEYHVYRDGVFIGTVRRDADLLARPRRVSFTDSWAAPGQRYRYEVVAVITQAGASVESSPAEINVVTPPIVVALDPGHGGKDPGAAGSY